MFLLSLYLLHQSCSSEFPPALPFQQPLFIPLFRKWTYSGLWSPIFCCHWEPLFSPFSMVFFLLKTGGVFSYFQSSLPHATRYFSSSSHTFPLTAATAPCLTTVFMSAPSLCAEVDFCHLQTTALVQGKLWDMLLFPDHCSSELKELVP